MKNKKNKKILARVGAMVAAVLLVALCALPVLADEGNANVAPTDVLPYFIKYYGLDNGIIQPLRMILEDTTFSFAETPYLFQFHTPAIGSTFMTQTYTTDKITTDYLGYFCVFNINGLIHQVFDDCYLTTSHTTSSGNKFVYFDVNQLVGTDYERVLRIRLKINNTSGELVECELSGAFAGSADNYVFAAATDLTNADVLPYGFSMGYLEPSIWVNWFDFRDTFWQTYNEAYMVGYDYAFDYAKEVEYNRGYDDGMKQTSLLDGVTAIFRAPMELIDGVLNFDLFGINMATAVRVLITMAIIGVCVTIVWKAVK